MKTHSTTHGDCDTPEYSVWRLMKYRCANPNARDFIYYGARGISVCEHWFNSYEAFLADMGRRPSPKHSIDRINNNGNYEPGNCRWATAAEQANNRRRKGSVMALSQAERSAEFRRRRDEELRALRAERTSAGDSFARACFSIAQERATNRDRAEFITDDRLAQHFVGRAAIAPGSTTAVGWTGLIQGAWGGFLGSLAAYGATPRLVELAQAVDPSTGVAVTYPHRTAGPTGAAFVAELDAIPIASSTFATDHRLVVGHRLGYTMPHA